MQREMESGEQINLNIYIGLPMRNLKKGCFACNSDQHSDSPDWSFSSSEDDDNFNLSETVNLESATSDESISSRSLFYLSTCTRSYHHYSHNGKSCQQGHKKEVWSTLK